MLSVLSTLIQTERGEAMFALDYRDSKPIYLQVKDSLYQLMLSGALVQGEQLPTVRNLASSLAINPNTIARAYDLLEKENLIYTVQGKGCFVAPLGQLTDRRKVELLAELDKLVQSFQGIGVEKEEILEYLSKEKEGGTI